jgi:hypothetical protein
LVTEQDAKGRELAEKWRREDEEARKTKWDKVWNNYGVLSQSTSRSPERRPDRIDFVRESVESLISKRMQALEGKMLRSEETYRSQALLRVQLAHQNNERID